MLNRLKSFKMKKHQSEDDYFMVQLINICRLGVILFTFLFFFNLISSPSILHLVSVIASLTYLRSTFEFKSLFSYLGIWGLLLIQYVLFVYVITYFSYQFHELVPYLILMIFQPVFYIIYQPMFSKLLFILTPFSSK